MRYNENRNLVSTPKYANLSTLTIHQGYLSPFENFTFALKSKDVKRQYPSLLNRFMTFLNLEGDIEQRCIHLRNLATNDHEYFQSNLMRFCNEQKRRIENGEISEGTMRNYIKTIKLFCEMNEIHKNSCVISIG